MFFLTSYSVRPFPRHVRILTDTPLALIPLVRSWTWLAIPPTVPRGYSHLRWIHVFLTPLNESKYQLPFATMTRIIPFNSITYSFHPFIPRLGKVSLYDTDKLGFCILIMCKHSLGYTKLSSN